ncbi:class A beta-lactamase [Actinophytocola sp. NPDC049390]|uniref:class A beta-lactamase n=1 Tax=Actinophytocola sp. NPDC049390 TaxID=3363894 RepID=UPI0037B9D411
MGNSRLALFAGLLSLGLVAGCSAAPPSPRTSAAASAVSSTSVSAVADPALLRDLEERYAIRLGVYAVNVHTGRTLSYRADESFPMMSTFKTYAAAALLRLHPLEEAFFGTVVNYTEDDLVANSPVTSERVATGMTVAELCEAAITRSDNTAANLLLRLLGGPEAITAFARDIKDTRTRLDRWEPELNTAVPGDNRDTTTPAAIGEGYRSLVLGEPERARLKDWLLANKTGGERIRAGLPADWTTADKTGSGDHGSANDVAITWTPDGTPIVIAVLTTKEVAGAEYDNAALADAAKVAAQALA